MLKLSPGAEPFPPFDSVTAAKQSDPTRPDQQRVPQGAITLGGQTHGIERDFKETTAGQVTNMGRRI